jgi:hypothetical protein
MKLDISGNEKGFRNEIIKFIALNTSMVTKKNTRFGSGIKFVSISSECVCITKTTKNFLMGI